MRCPGCGYLGPPPAEALRPLHHVARVLAGIDQRERQLTAAQRRTLLLGRSGSGCFVVLALLLGAPFACLTLLTLFTLLGGRGELSDAVVGLVPLLAFLSAVLVLGLWAKVSRAALERAAVAFPPAAPGEPASCHTCGGPVPVGAEPLVRCAYCGADNLVEARALQRAGSRRDLILDAWEVDIEREARATASTNRLATALLVPAAIFFPVGAFLVGVAVLMSIERPAVESVEYVEHTTAAGQPCIARLLRDGAGGRIDWDYSPPAGEKNESQPAPPQPRTFRASSVVGRELVANRNQQMGRVVRVFTNMLDEDRNEIELALPNGARASQSLAGTCSRPAPPTAEADGSAPDGRGPAADAGAADARRPEAGSDGRR